MNKAMENPKQDALLPAIALILLGFVILSRPTPFPHVSPLTPLAGHTGGTCAPPPRLRPAPRRAVCDWRGPPGLAARSPLPGSCAGAAAAGRIGSNGCVTEAQAFKPSRLPQTPPPLGTSRPQSLVLPSRCCCFTPVPKASMASMSVAVRSAAII